VEATVVDTGARDTGVVDADATATAANTNAPHVDAQPAVDERARNATVESPAAHQQHRSVRSERGRFTSHRFESEAGALDYKLYVPARIAATRPLLIMLHGCTQAPDDFARGTGMNALADEHGYVVAYPAQSPRNNATRCWNWFRSGDQQRGRGEPALLAALATHIADAHQLDKRSVFVAGLSAGGAMAAVLASTYPDVFAAAGVHSGLPHGAAHDVASALAAMKRVVPPRAGAVHATPMPVPLIVFHGDRDTTVDAANGAAIVAHRIDATGNRGDAASQSVERGTAPAGRTYTRTIHRDAAGAVIAEHWLVHGAGHAWSGGDAAGSYTDPTGPDASREMLRFFAERTPAPRA
jgi:poly(hydroxyalkanoate) depolymerase family esterase